MKATDENRLLAGWREKVALAALGARMKRLSADLSRCISSEAHAREVLEGRFGDSEADTLAQELASAGDLACKAACGGKTYTRMERIVLRAALDDLAADGDAYVDPGYWKALAGEIDASLEGDVLTVSVTDASGRELHSFRAPACDVAGILTGALGAPVNSGEAQ